MMFNKYALKNLITVMKFTAEILIQPFRNSKRAFPDCAFFSQQLGKHFKLEIEMPYRVLISFN